MSKLCVQIWLVGWAYTTSISMKVCIISPPPVRRGCKGDRPYYTILRIEHLILNICDHLVHSAQSVAIELAYSMSMYRYNSNSCKLLVTAHCPQANYVLFQIGKCRTAHTTYIIYIRH